MTTRKPSKNRQITCGTCEHDQFERSLSETEAVVKLSFAKDMKRVIEKIIKEGAVRFRYECNNCGTPLIHDFGARKPHGF